MLEIRKNGCVVCRCEFERWGFEANLSTQNWKWGLYTLTPKRAHPNPILSVFQKWPRAARQRSCDLVRFISGLSPSVSTKGEKWVELSPNPFINYFAGGENGSADLCTIILNFPSLPFLKTQVLSTITSFPSLPVTQTFPMVIATDP
jgi:hypothetical protein